MKYVAVYDLTPDLQAKLQASVQGMVRTDHYYSRQLNCKYGTQILHACTDYDTMNTTYSNRMGSSIKEVEEFTLTTEELLKYNKHIGWRTCNGNYESILIPPAVAEERWLSKIPIVLYVREGRRHGITTWFNQFIDLDPISIFQYDTKCPKSNPFDYDLSNESSSTQYTGSETLDTKEGMSEMIHNLYNRYVREAIATDSID